MGGGGRGGRDSVVVELSNRQFYVFTGEFVGLWGLGGGVFRVWGVGVDGVGCGGGIRGGFAWWVESCRGSESETETETIDGCVARSHSRTHCVRTMILMIL